MPAKEAGPAPHERILDVARELFCRDGVHATGIDRILNEAGASKMTLYARFGSKDALLAAVLREEARRQRAHLFGAMDAAGPDPAARLHQVVPAMRTWFGSERFYGCALMNAVAEHTKGDPGLRALAAEHHREILAVLQADAAAAGLPDPAVLARQLLLLMDGMIAAFMVSGDDAVLDVAERTLAALLGPPQSPAVPSSNAASPCFQASSASSSSGSR